MNRIESSSFLSSEIESGTLIDIFMSSQKSNRDSRSSRKFYHSKIESRSNREKKDQVSPVPMKMDLVFFGTICNDYEYLQHVCIIFFSMFGFL